MAIVATYQFGTTVVHIDDDAYKGKTEEELERIRYAARVVACGIIDRARERGEDV